MVAKKKVMVCFVVLLVSASSAAESLPKWEAGIAIGGQATPDYRGSKSEQVQAYPFPFFVYRGDLLKADRGGVRGEFFSNDNIELNVSGEIALNGGSDDNELRVGMPELDSAFEFGPSLNINLSGDDFNSGWQLRLPMRFVVTIGNAGIHQRGYIFNPDVAFIEPKLFGDWRAMFTMGALYGSESYHDYYYTVANRFATENRSSYKAENGFSGYSLKSSISRRKGDFWYGLRLRYDNLNGTVFEDSPLVETDSYFAVSFAIGWVGWRSKN